MRDAIHVNGSECSNASIENEHYRSGSEYRSPLNLQRALIG